MPTVNDVLDAIERIAPANTAFAFDKVGLQFGEKTAPIETGVVALDCSPGLIDFAKAKNAQIAVCHHPIIWDPLAAVNSSTRSGRLAVELIRNRIAFIGCHTNWDAAPGGVNDTLAQLLGLTDVRPIGESAKVPYLKLAVFVPRGTKDKVIDALSASGAGVVGLYERCAFMAGGTGTYRGLAGSNPTIGKAGKVEFADEIRVEMRLPESLAEAVVRTLEEVHPYEEPAYDLYPLRAESPRPISRIGHISPIKLSAFQNQLDQALQTRSWTWGDPDRMIEKVAVCGGAADGEWVSAKAEGADLFVTGEVRHHIAIEATEAGLAILAGGHFATEHPGCASLRDVLAKEAPGVEWHLCTPPAGATGNALTP
jgi:dinuclear metal center YbgI/SA1388 family protein